MAGVGTKAVVVVFDLYFYMVSGALLSPPQPLKKNRHANVLAICYVLEQWQKFIFWLCAKSL